MTAPDALLALAGRLKANARTIPYVHGFPMTWSRAILTS